MYGYTNIFNLGWRMAGDAAREALLKSSADNSSDKGT